MRIYQCTGSELAIKIMAGEEASMLLMKIRVTIEVGEINAGSLLKQMATTRRKCIGSVIVVLAAARLVEITAKIRIGSIEVFGTSSSVCK